jgi:hypothetical protein
MSKNFTSEINKKTDKTSGARLNMSIEGTKTSGYGGIASDSQKRSEILKKAVYGLPQGGGNQNEKENYLPNHNSSQNRNSNRNRPIGG